MRRRDLLQGAGALALSACFRPAGAAANAKSAPPGPVLLLVELNGGPDTLQMVIPRDPSYRSRRPQLAVSSDQIASLDEATGLNQRMAALLPMWAARELAIVRGVGYAPPNRSHFRSIEIWNQASTAVLDSGWVPRMLAERTLDGAGLIDGVVLGGDPGPLAGPGARTVVIQHLDRFLRQAARIPDGASTESDNPALAHILEVRGRVDAAAADLEARLRGAPRLRAEFPRSGLGQQLAVAARLIAAQAPVRVIKVRQGGYDTHAGQPHKLDNLMSALAEGLAALRTALVESGDWRRTLVMTYAEFGRRVQENGSRGTDHGTAASHFVAGGAVKGGLYGQMPSLAALEGGDLKHHVDFRRLYADAARHLRAPGAILAPHRPLGLV